MKALRMEEGLERGFDEVKQVSGFVTANSMALLTIFQVSQTQNAAVVFFEFRFCELLNYSANYTLPFKLFR